MGWITRRFLAPAAAAGAAVSITGTAQAQTADARAALAASSVIEEIKRRNSLRVGMSTFVPWAFRNRAGELIGYEIDVATRLAQDMGVRVEFVPTAWDGIVPALLAGRFDMIIGGMTVTAARNLSANFTNSYSASGVDLAASRRLAEGMTTMEAWNRPNVTISGRRGTSALAAAQRLFPRATFRQFDDDAQSVLEVVNGRAHGMVGSMPRPRFAVLENEAALFSPFAQPLARQIDSMALRKGDPDALNFLNNWIASRQLDGFLEERQAYWFQNREWRDQVPG
ncbi:transporter substrate-binding domain-containing protein [Falsiroseomonas stagni]|uniref:Amino acid ABC transporter substrate-binding protein, PAAT family n=1 Tax=Falsiroseomonas stagni DSM 19981 TaxID=1123062 RepID=A0A1I4F1T8_9PROT|nr:transporter substrate-binding domain-containing protein [Falsiroseomonas stagni]SFL11529.1 amino acid ABC transporter substrate-binding protein, PAAT family [Falsiroseomonas stagni DSM 19981]